MIHIPVRVSAESIQQEEANEVLAKINRHAIEPFESLDQLFVFSGICSNDRLDSYFTRMDANTTLRNYEEDLKAGVSLQEGHDISKAPYGRSFDADYIRAREVNEFNSVRGYWYIMRDIMINGQPTNDRIRAIQGGIQKDLSVGFGGDQMFYRCSSCGNDLFDYRCDHFPGLEDEHGRMVFAWVVNARLREVSTVYKGATPGASITRNFADKAQSYVNQKQLSEKNIMKLENAYQIRLDHGKGRSFYMPENNQKEDENMGNQARNSLLDDIRQAIRENKIEKSVVYDILAEEGDPFRQPEDIALRNELGKDYCKPEAVRQLKKEAQQGRRYLADVIDQAVAARVKAQGDSFNSDSYRQMLSLSGDIDHIKEEIDSYERLAKQRFAAGRQTEEEDLNKDQDQNDEDQSTYRIDPDEDNIFGGAK